jgi:ATP-dependent Zn protease
MKFKAAFAVAVMTLMAFAVCIPAESDDAALKSVTIEQGYNLTFDKDRGMTITVDYKSDKNESCTVTLYNTATSKAVWSQRMDFEVGGGSFTIPLETQNNELYPGNSSTNMKITFTNPAVYQDVTFTINYTTSIWSNWAIYAAIIIVVILIAALVVFKSRMAPKEKNQMTFEQIEAMKQAEKENQPERKSAVRSERRRYLDSKKK